MFQTIRSVFSIPTKNRYALLNATKTIIACAIGLGVGSVLDTFLEMPPAIYSWIVITILIVMPNQPNLGGIVNKAIYRMVGTVIGAISGIAILFLFPDWYQLHFLFGAIIIAASVYIANTTHYNDAGALTALTLYMVLLGYSASIVFGIYRMVEVLLGILIALMVNRYIFPIKATTRLRSQFQESMHEINAIHRYLMRVNLKPDTRQRLEDDQEKLFQMLIDQMNLLKEMRYEKRPRTAQIYHNIVVSQRRLYRYLRVSYDFVHVYLTTANDFATNRAFVNLHKDLSTIFQSLADGFEKTDQLDFSYYSACEQKIYEFGSRSDSHESKTLYFLLKRIIDAAKRIRVLQRAMHQKV